jgi:hypothetical protein
MHCYICDREHDNVAFNKDHNRFDPCPTCLAAVAEVFGEEQDADEVESPEEFLELENQYELDLDDLKNIE